MTGLVLLVGAVLGVGLWLLVLAVRPRPPRLDRALAALAQPAEPPTVDPDAGWAARLGTPAVRLLTRAGLPTAKTRANLAVISKPVRVHLAEQAATATVGFLLPPLLSVLLALAGAGGGLALPLAGSLACAVLGWLVPELSVAADARDHQAAFRHALGSYLDLVVVALAGGAGVDQALDDAATVGHGPAYAEIRYALQEARLARIPPWETLSALGKRVGVVELAQLASTVGLAGSEGARVRASLQSRAATLRTRLLTDIEGKATAATERMAMPVVLLFGAFLILVGYPAMSAVLTGL